MAAELTDAPVDRGAAVEVDEAHVVDVLLHDRDDVRRLHDVVVVVVGGGQRRDAAIPDAPVAVVELGVGVGGNQSFPHILQPLPGRRRDVRFRFRREGWQTPVRRVDDERGAPRRDHRRPAVEPEAVVGADVAAHRQRLGAHDAGSVRAGVGFDHAPLDDRGFLLGQELLAGLRLRALERRHRRAVPDAPDVGVAPGRSRRYPTLRRRRLGPTPPPAPARRSRPTPTHRPRRAHEKDGSSLTPSPRSPRR